MQDLFSTGPYSMFLRFSPYAETPQGGSNSLLLKIDTFLGF